MGVLEADQPPTSWPQVLHDWLRASSNRDAAGWRACLHDDARSVVMDGSVTAGADAIVENLAAFYAALDAHETVERWIHGSEDVFVWHGTVEPQTEFATPYCTVCTLRAGRIAELRFFADTTALTRAMAARAA